MTSTRLAKSFRPSLEGLEDRQMPDAGLGRALLRQPAPLTAALVSTPAPRGEAPPRGALPQGLTFQSDLDTVKERAESLLKDKVIGTFNRWALNTKGMYLEGSSQTGDPMAVNLIEVKFRAWYGAGGGTGASIRMLFEGRLHGGDMVYTLKEAGMANYTGWFGGAFEGVAKDLFKATYAGGIAVRRFDVGHLTQNVVVNTQNILRDSGVDPSNFSLKGIEAIEGGIRVWFSGQKWGVYTTGFKMDFKFNVAKDGRIWFQSERAESGKWDRPSGAWIQGSLYQCGLNELALSRLDRMYASVQA